MFQWHQIHNSVLRFSRIIHRNRAVIHSEGIKLSFPVIFELTFSYSVSAKIFYFWGFSTTPFDSQLLFFKQLTYLCRYKNGLNEVHHRLFRSKQGAPRSQISSNWTPVSFSPTDHRLNRLRPPLPGHTTLTRPPSWNCHLWTAVGFRYFWLLSHTCRHTHTKCANKYNCLNTPGTPAHQARIVNDVYGQQVSDTFTVSQTLADMHAEIGKQI